MEGQMNMHIGMNTSGGSRESRIELKFQELALELASEVGIKEDELNIFLEDSKIYEALQKKAQAAIEDEDKRRKDEILAAARKKLGIVIEKPKEVLTPVVLNVPQQPTESAWQKYLSEGNHSLSNSLAQLKTHEEVSAARGFLIGVLRRHRQNNDLATEELMEAAGIWDGRAQNILRIINNFFGSKENISTASRGVYDRVSSLLEGDGDLRWYMNGPAGIQVELEAKKKERDLAHETATKRQQRREDLEMKKQEISDLLAAKNILKEDARRLAGATIKKFPDLEIREALVKMAINRQVAAIQQNRDFLEEVAPEAQAYLLGSGVSENKFFLEVSQHTEVISLLNRDVADSKICRR
ncbi:MAG: hypothetical protein UR51_C0005G0073 [Candidatus Moranbacteria bacterium GW2011_GWF1_34_10]|nr:MAG: hypothetical protein UR51_C0005G0073 [Candidatus Moranbacteria bacterium GW2011_GWF1_34_10]